MAATEWSLTDDASVPGGTFFFTVTLADRSTDVLVQHLHLLGDALRATQAERPFRVLAMVVLPEHLHAVFALPGGDGDFPARWRGIKAGFTARVAASGQDVCRDAAGKRRLWQRRYCDHVIRDATDLRHHVDYIHYNPVKHGLVARPLDWRWSTLHRHVAAGVIEPDWACDPETTAGSTALRHRAQIPDP